MDISFVSRYQRKTDRFVEFIAEEVVKTNINEICHQLNLGYQELKSVF